MAKASAEDPSLEQVVHEIRIARLKRFFSLSEKELEELSSKHESMLSFLYEIYRRYGERMDERMKSAVTVYLLSREPDFEKVYRSLNADASNRGELLRRISSEKPRDVLYN